MIIRDNYLDKIKSVILDMIAKNDIDYDYKKILDSDYNTVLDISSIDKVKIILKLETIFSININDDYLQKLTCIDDFAQAVVKSIETQKVKEEEIEALITKVLDE